MIVHPLCPTHIGTDSMKLLEEEEKCKEDGYKQPLALLHAAQACRAGLRKIVFRACADTSLGRLSAQSVKLSTLLPASQAARCGAATTAPSGRRPDTIAAGETL